MLESWYWFVFIMVLLTPIAFAWHRSRAFKSKMDEAVLVGCLSALDVELDDMDGDKPNHMKKMYTVFLPIYGLALLLTLIMLPTELFWGGAVCAGVILGIIAALCSAEKVEHIALIMWSVIVLFYVVISYGSVLMNRLQLPMLQPTFFRTILVSTCMYAAYAWNIISEMSFKFLQSKYLTMQDRLTEMDSAFSGINGMLRFIFNIVCLPIFVLISSLFSLNGLALLGRIIINVFLPLVILQLLASKSKDDQEKEAELCDIDLFAEKVVVEEEEGEGDTPPGSNDITGSPLKMMVALKEVLVAILLVVVFVVGTVIMIAYGMMASGTIWPTDAPSCATRAFMGVLNWVKLVDFDEFYRAPLYDTFVLMMERSLFSFVGVCKDLQDTVSELRDAKNMDARDKLDALTSAAENVCAEHKRFGERLGEIDDHLAIMGRVRKGKHEAFDLLRSNQKTIKKLLDATMEQLKPNPSLAQDENTPKFANLDKLVKDELKSKHASVTAFFKTQLGTVRDLCAKLTKESFVVRSVAATNNAVAYGMYLATALAASISITFAINDAETRRSEMIICSIIIIAFYVILHYSINLLY